MELILDTNFIVALEREASRQVAGPAHAFLQAHAADHYTLTFTVVGELACGQSASARRDWEKLCQPFPVIEWSRDIAWSYGELFRHLQTKGQLIGTNDLWIAATALAHDLPLVTNNTTEFARVPGLIIHPFKT